MTLEYRAKYFYFALKVPMKKPTLQEIIISLAILIGVPAWLYFDWRLSRPKADKRTVEEIVRSCFGLELTNLQSSLTMTPVQNVGQSFVRVYSVSMTVTADAIGYTPPNLQGNITLDLVDKNQGANFYTIDRETNGNYLVSWNTLYASSGSHDLQMILGFTVAHPYRGVRVRGPVLTQTVTNLLQWDYESVAFGRWSEFKAKLQTPSADYSIFIYDTNRVLIKRIDGHTDSGSIFERCNIFPTNKHAWKNDDLKSEIAIIPTINGADGQTKSNAPTMWFPYP